MRAALVEVLRMLNAAEHYDSEKEKGLDLDEIQAGLQPHWSVQRAGVKPAVVVGLLLRNKMADHVPGTTHSWVRGRDFGPHYRISGGGKVFLKEYLDESQRIHGSGTHRI